MKRILTVFLILCLIVSSVGCSGKNGQSSALQNGVSASRDKVVDCYVEYDAENKRHLLLFGLADAEGTYFSSAGLASITMTDYAGDILFQRSLSFGEHFFSEWMNSSWDKAKLLCAIYIEDSYITGDVANSKTLTLQITLNDERFFDVGDIAVTQPSADGDNSNKFSPYGDSSSNGADDGTGNQGGSGFVDDSSPSQGSQPTYPTTLPQTPTKPITVDQQMKNEAAACGAPYEKLGRALVWHDEFDGTTLDKNKWEFSETMWNAKHEHVNDSRHVRVDGGKLHMQIHKSSKSGKTYSMASGVATTNTMLFKYGYLEMRAKVPFRKGAWPSFWCTSKTPLQEAKDRMEVDIFEVWSSTDRLSANLHKWSTDGTKHVAIPSGGNWPNLTYIFKNPANLNNEYHTYGFEWDKKTMSFYVDDFRFATINIASESANFGAGKGYLPEMDMFQDWLRVIINNECFGQGDPYATSTNVLTDSDTMPIDYYIDYVRLYQNTNQGETFKTTAEIAAIVANK